MFIGTTPPEVRFVLQDIMSKVKSTKDVYCACSGNYTSDKLMYALGFNVHSNDVSLYSKLIADAVMNKDTTPIKIKDERFEKLFKQWDDNPLKKLCEVMFVMKFAEFLPRKNEYQMMMYDAVMSPEQSIIYYKSTLEKLNKGALDFKIADFFYGDFVDHLKAKKGKGVGIAFPPTYKGGYEKIFKAVEDTFEYEHAPYEIFEPKTADTLFGELLQQDENIIYTDNEFESLSDYLMAKIQLGDKHPVILYSSVKDTKNYYVEKNVTPQRSQYLVAPIDFDFNESTKITVKIVKVADINYFKGFYMANKVNYTNGGNLGLMFFADGLAFGFASLSSQVGGLGCILGLSDFVINSHTKKLSKLLIMLELSHEVRMILAKELCEYYTYIKTPVYTKSPVSMKYRGVFKLVSREPGKLMYQGEFTNESLENIYKKWLKKYKEQ